MQNSTDYADLGTATSSVTFFRTIGGSFGVASVEHGRPYVDKLVEAGHVRRDDGVLQLTPAGGAAADRLFAAGREGLEQLLSGWSPEQHADLARMLDKLSRALLGESADEHLIAR